MKAHALILAAIQMCACAVCTTEPWSYDQPSTILFHASSRIEISTDQTRFVINSNESVTLSGSLQLPAGKGPFPAVVLAHGCSGIGGTEHAWAETLRRWGYATFLANSFSGRNLASVCDNPWLLAPLQRVPDVYGALRTLAANPAIDARRIALMGFSHGGIVVLSAATTWASQIYAPDGLPSFRAFIAFYPYCNVSFPEQYQLSGPLRIHSGELDDWTPSIPCSDLASELKRRGEDADISIYAGAHHSFDAIGAGHVRLPDAINAAACSFSVPSILGPFPARDEIQHCIKRGATVEESPAATSAARNQVRMELEVLLH